MERVQKKEIIEMEMKIEREREKRRETYRGHSSTDFFISPSRLPTMRFRRALFFSRSSSG
jgi:hypothetical protein